jgi:hypothetical protein
MERMESVSISVSGGVSACKKCYEYEKLSVGMSEDLRLRFE